MAAKKAIKKKDPSPVHFNLLFLVIAAFAAYIPSLGNDFVNWDDVVYIMNNDMIKTLDIENLKKMFSSYFMGNYHPLTILSFAFDYSIFQVNAPGYHLHNLVLHIMNAMLVYFITWHLFKKNNLAAFIVAILFAVHPMHVESVAWVSERKDLLYALYFLAAMLSYIYYDKTGKKMYFFLALASFILSLLAKAQAVTLPVVLLLIDYLLVRKPDIKMFLEKVPFFILSLVFGLIAIKAQQADGAVNSIGISQLNSIFYAQYSLGVYLFKLILPINLTCLYEYPFTPDGRVPFYIYLSPLVVIALLIIILKTWKKNPAFCFGILFFLVVIFPVLQFLPVGQAIVAERYSYLPYIGLFFVMTVLFFQLRERYKNQESRRVMNYIGIGIILTFCILTWNRTKVWAESVSLWTDVMQKEPSCMSAYINRSYMYLQYKQYDKAIRDCNDGLKIDSNRHKLYINRGTAYRAMGMYDLALNDFTTAILKNPESIDTYLDRGILYTDHFDQYDRGISDFRKFLTFKPRDKNGNYNLAVAFYKNHDFDSSLYYCDRTLEISPDYVAVHYIRALVYAAQKDYVKAYENGNKAQSLGFSVDPALLSRWRENAHIVIRDLK